MLLNKELFGNIAQEAARSPQLRMFNDLCNSDNGDSQSMINFLLPGTKTAIFHHTDTSEMFVCIYGSAIERFYNEQVLYIHGIK